MKKLLLLSLFLSTTLKAQISIGNLFSTDEANQMTINWRCTGEAYPNVAQLPDAETITVKVKGNGKVKLSPNIFNDKFKPKKILSMLGIGKNQGVQKQAVSVDDSDCMASFYKTLKDQFGRNTSECATKNSSICKLTSDSFVDAIQKQVEESDYAKKVKDSHKLPRQLAFNVDNQVEYELWFKQTEAFCSGQDYDKKLILTKGFLKKVNSFSEFTTSQPGVECLDKMKAELDQYSEALMAEHCAVSEEICDYFKQERQDVAASFEAMKNVRKAMILKKEKEYKEKINQDWEKDYAESFASMIDVGQSGNCDDFTNNILNSSKTKLMSPVTMTNLVTKNMDSLFAKMDASCQHQFIRQYVEQNSFDSVVQDGYGYKQFCKFNKSKICSENRQYTADIEKNIERMLKLAYGEYGKDYFREQILACEKDNITDLNSLLNKLKGFDQKMTCAPLKEGEGKVVSGGIPTGLSARYALQRTGPKETTAIVNMNFITSTGAQVSPQAMEERVKSCLDNVSPFMKGPGGESLKVKIVNPAEAKELPGNIRPAQNTVYIAAPSVRSNSAMYESDADCTVITHEVMHLFGLCDEYKEEWNSTYYDVATGAVVAKGTPEEVAAGKLKNVNNSNCRNVVTVPSIMKDQSEVFGRAVPRSVSCECVGAFCKSFMSSEEPIQKLYQNYGWDVIDSTYRNKFCASTPKPSLTKAKYLEDPKQFKFLSEATTDKISYNFKYATEDEIKSYDLTCDCSKPKYPVESNDVDTCRMIVANVAKGIAEDTPKSNTTCPPGSIEKNVKWGGNPEALGAFDGNSYQVFKKKLEPAMDSILYPEQFNRIVGGACPEVSVLYSKCSQYAYKTVSDTNTCNVPPECKDMNSVLGIAQ